MALNWISAFLCVKTEESIQHFLDNMPIFKQENSYCHFLLHEKGSGFNIESLPVQASEEARFWIAEHPGHLNFGPFHVPVQKHGIDLSINPNRQPLVS